MKEKKIISRANAPVKAREQERAEADRVVFCLESLAAAGGEDLKSVHNFLGTGRRHNKEVMGDLI